MTRRPADRAVSLLELVTVLTILGVMAAVGGPRYANSLALYRASAAAARIAADVNLARWRAKATSGTQSISFTVASGVYALPGVTGPQGEATYTVAIAAEPYAATLVSASFNSTPLLSFDRYGQPSAGGTVVVRSGTATKRVTVDAVTGLASVS